MQRDCPFEQKVVNAKYELATKLGYTNKVQERWMPISAMLPQDKEEHKKTLRTVIESARKQMVDLSAKDLRWDINLASIQAATELLEEMEGRIGKYNWIYASMIDDGDVLLNDRILDSLIEKKRRIFHGLKKKYERVKGQVMGSETCSKEDTLFLMEYGASGIQLVALYKVMQPHYDKAMSKGITIAQRPSDEDIAKLDEIVDKIEEEVDEILSTKCGNTQ